MPFPLEECARSFPIRSHHDGVEKLVDVEEITEEDKIKPTWHFGLKEAEGRKRRMVRAVEGKEKFHLVQYEQRKYQSARCVQRLKWVEM